MKFFQESISSHAPIFLPEKLLSSQEDESKDKYLLGKFGFRVFFFSFYPPAYLVAPQAKKLEHQKNYLKKFGFMEN